MTRDAMLIHAARVRDSTGISTTPWRISPSARKRIRMHPVWPTQLQ